MECTVHRIERLGGDAVPSDVAPSMEVTNIRLIGGDPEAKSPWWSWGDADPVRIRRDPLLLKADLEYPVEASERDAMAPVLELFQELASLHRPFLGAEHIEDPLDRTRGDPGATGRGGRRHRYRDQAPRSTPDVRITCPTTPATRG